MYPASKLVPANYPPLDKTPPIDSPEVKAWIQLVANSGVDIPNLSPTVAGGCGANAAAAADQSRCWWTCGGYTAETDITACPDKLTWGVSFDDGPAPYSAYFSVAMPAAQHSFFLRSSVSGFPWWR